ncbi:bifunctional 2-C-methyl-D-erythritol 4-phosphate cytidylyltransferase/2-C-methyl-D-erythritol 2,4-cyclodiphosphate synthase [Virgibacillus sp. MSP4-1]|nr:bifunctional 2-C-methyl-D-erythritol 4-phosphate cytidylyltransferase/2-C-methyl-D-erythritol 2,4-cyclodiphosphate synthase [Virgibacillus sp. MSP4-1]QHS23919.1 bifunctional 2-C-methyl-D-erythritol 4-phosphate cytidylyltransferase/2-C-methyl-D-erythritol 2,4-cyclodiphosphate synthase [Virgibacillus sp. MSP4-1]
MDYQVIVLAAGLGKRMKMGRNKQFLQLNSKPLVIHTLEVFEQDSWCTDVYLVVNPKEKKDMEALVDEFQFAKITELVDGGAERQDSVNNGLMACKSEDIVLIHDGARPFVAEEAIHRLVECAEEKGAGLLAVPVTDTVKRKEGELLETLDRKTLWAAQTPQGFQYQKIKQAHDQAGREGYRGTDDASLVERLGEHVEIVHGSYDNFKLTTPEDIKKAENLLREREESRLQIKVGTGYDVHQLVDGRPCIIGGVTIPYEKGLLGHSDADVLLHTVADACLGAIGKGDIGTHFPDTDAAFKDADSKVLLKEVWNLVKNQGLQLGNIDCTIIAQAPKMSPYIVPIKENVAEILEADPSQVNIKATTTEKLGFTGRKEGIAAQATVLLQNK